MEELPLAVLAPQQVAQTAFSIELNPGDADGLDAFTPLVEVNLRVTELGKSWPEIGGLLLTT